MKLLIKETSNQLIIIGCEDIKSIMFTFPEKMVGFFINEEEPQEQRVKIQLNENGVNEIPPELTTIFKNRHMTDITFDCFGPDYCGKKIFYTINFLGFSTKTRKERALLKQLSQKQITQYKTKEI